MQSRLVFALLVLTVALSPALLSAEEPVTADDGNLTITTADDEFGLQFTGRFQLQALYLNNRDRQPSHRSDLFLRRVQPNLEGHILDRRLTYRLRFDVSRQATLRDAFVDYRLRGSQLRIRAGQFNIPFDWERDVAPPRFTNIERSQANTLMGWPTGRDVGVMVHGRPNDYLDYATGIFNGQGVNQRRNNSAGFTSSSRFRLHPTGEAVRHETLLEPADTPRLSLSIGHYSAFNSGARSDWTPFLEDQSSEADLVAATTDLQIQWSRLSGSVSAYFRQIRPDDQDSYDGHALNAHLGALAVDNRLFVGGRFGQVRPIDLDGQPTIYEARANLHLFHRGHDSKLILEGGADSLRDDDLSQNTYRATIQYQLLY